MTRRLSDQDRRVWHRVARTVRVAPGRTPASAPEEPSPASEAKSAPSAPKSVRAAPPRTKVPPAPAAPPAPADVSGQRRIRRGQVEIEARLDLHGHTQDAARRELADFLAREQAGGARCVLVITGKGRAGAGVLRGRLQDWLAAPDLRPLIAGQSRAHIRHGGDGAVYVLLKAKRD